MYQPNHATTTHKSTHRATRRPPRHRPAHARRGLSGAPGAARRLPTLIGAAIAAAVVGTAGSIALSGASAGQLSDSASKQCAAMHNAVYERINPKSQASLLTTARTEADDAAKRHGFTVYRGIPFQASAQPASGLTAVLRLRNSLTLDFFWTTSRTEAERAVTRYGYSFTASTFYAAAHPATCKVPVYRYQHAGHHRYAVASAERAALTKAGWRFEGVAFYGAAHSTNTPKPPVSSSTRPSSSSASQPSPSASKTATSTSANPNSSPPPATQTAPPTPSEPTSSTPGGSDQGGPLSRPLYLMPSGHPWTAYQAATDPTIKRQLWQIAGTPRALWLGGASGDQAQVDRVESAAVSAGATPVFVLYAIPNRDCGHYSAGGLSGTAQYEAWVDAVRKGIAGRPAVVIIEPDAIGWGCLSSADQAARITMMKYALQTMSADRNTWAYVHAGSSGLSAQGIASNLKQIGIQDARGFAINVSSFDTTSSEIAYGKAIDAALGMQKHFVIDTSRNGLGRYTGTNGGAPSWCNPPGRAVGARPTTQTADPLVDAYLWVKTPGGSDGDCHDGDPPAGGWFQSYALDLVQRAVENDTIQYRATAS